MANNIAAALKAKRKDMGLSVKEVLDSLRIYGIDISDKTLYGWESGHRQPDADTFLTLCRIYEIDSISEIVDIETTPPTEDEALLKSFHRLNDEGKEKLLDYADDLVASGRYTKESGERLA